MSAELDDDGWPVIPDPESIPDEFDEQPVEKPKKKDGRKGWNTKKNRKANSGSFVAGDGRSGDAPRKIPPKPVPGEGFLRDLRHCLINPKIRDRTPGEKIARQILVTKPLQFFERLEKLESEERSAKNNVIDTGPDLGHDAAMRVLDRLLDQIPEALPK